MNRSRASLRRKSFPRRPLRCRFESLEEKVLLVGEPAKN